MQVIPHITDEIKRSIQLGAGDADVCMVEIGGTVGDIESLPFLEAIRQMGVELGRDNCVYMHLTLVPVVGGSGEIKTKPTQHSVKELRGIGIQPDVLLCRCQDPLPDEQRRKIALFTNVEERAVISAVDADDIYKIPMLLHEQGLDDIVVEQAAPRGAAGRPARVAAGGGRQGAIRTAQVDIAMVGKYVQMRDSYISLNEALTHAGIKTPHARQRALHRIRPTSSSTAPAASRAWTRSWCRAASASAASRARSRRCASRARTSIPYLGICLGMQVAVIEYGRNVLGSTARTAPSSTAPPPHPVIALITEWQDARAARSSADEGSDLGGTMRLGAQEVQLGAGTLARDALRQRRDPRAPPPSLRVQQQLPRAATARRA